jgi:hypothetical protein
MHKMLIYSWCVQRQDFKSILSWQSHIMMPIFYLIFSSGSMFGFIQLLNLISESITSLKLLAPYISYMYLWLHHQMSSKFTVYVSVDAFTKSIITLKLVGIVSWNIKHFDQQYIIYLSTSRNEWWCWSSKTNRPEFSSSVWLLLYVLQSVL